MKLVWSLAATWHYVWWVKDEPHYYWQTYGGVLTLPPRPRFIFGLTRPHPL